MVNNTKLLKIIAIISLIMISGCSALSTTPENELTTNEYSDSVIEFDTAIESKNPIVSDDIFTNLSYDNKDIEIEIKAFEIDESFMLKKQNNQQSLSAMNGDTLSNMFSGYKFLGYDNNYIYVAYHEEDTLVISRINYIEKYIEEGIYFCKSEICFSYHLADNYLFIGEAEFVDGDVNSSVKRINLHDGNFTEEVIFQNISSKLPEIAYSNEYIIINYVNNYSSVLGYINNNNSEFVEIYRKSYEISNGNLYTGDIPITINGNNHGVYFQIISLENELLDFEGSSALYYYSFQKEEVVLKLNLTDKIIYIDGDEDVIVLEYYSVDNPREQTGKIISFQDNTIVDIPGVRPSNNIKNSNLKDDLFYIHTLSGLYIFNLKEGKFVNLDIDSSYQSEIKLFEESFAFLSVDSKKVILSIVE